ncbi:MAG: hypothetical protein R3F22_08190 [Lysobacteraceae bacterium]
MSTLVSAQTLFSHGFESARAQARGGSHLIWYDVDSACVAEPQAILTDYHQPGVRPQVLDTMAAMRAAGQQRVAVVIFHARGDNNPDGLVNELVLDSTGGTLNKQYITNLTRLLQDIRDAGFHELLLRFAPQWINNPQDWEGNGGWNQSLFDENWALIQKLHPVVAANGMPYRIDLGVEGLPRARIIAGHVIADQPDNEEWSDYAQRLWENYVNAYGKADSIGFSSVSGPDLEKADARVEHLRTIYRVNGSVELPPVIGVDLYAAGGISEGQFFSKWSQELDQEGLGDLPIIVPEVYYNDAVAADDIQAAMTATGRAVPYLLQWPLERDEGCYPGDPVSVSEPTAFQHYLEHGF